MNKGARISSHVSFSYGNTLELSGVRRSMDPNRFGGLIAAPIASIFLILVICVFQVQKPVSTGILIPMMRTRGLPLSNCEFNGFTVYLRSDGEVAGGDRDDVVPRDVMLSRVKEAGDNIQDETIFVIADPEVSYGDFASLIADIHTVAPPDHIAAVTQAAQIVAHLGSRDFSRTEVWADRCQFEWPAVTGQPHWTIGIPHPLPNAQAPVWEQIFGK